VKRYGVGSVVALLLSAALAPATAVSATATTEVVREIVPFVFNDVNPCNGEAVSITGELTLITRTTVDSNGTLHVAFTLVPSQVRGVGESGTGYKAVGGQREQFNVSLDEAPVTDTFTDIFNLISEGGTDNFSARTTFHITVNANGEVTASVLNIVEECRG
jgi:hypothetical protein